MASTTAAKTGGLTVTVNSNRKSVAETFIDVARISGCDGGLNFAPFWLECCSTASTNRPISICSMFTKDERPELISDWLKWLHEGQRAMEERHKALVEKYRRPEDT